jgi:hypothetical protein
VCVFRAEVFDGFQDFGVLVNGGFLYMPPPIFDLFKEEGSDKLFLPNLLLAVALFCGSNTEEKMDFIFDVFDLTSTNTLVAEDVLVLLKATFHALHCLDITHTKLTEDQLNSVKETFVAATNARQADSGNGDSSSGGIQKQVFCQWVVNEMVVEDIFSAFLHPNKLREKCHKSRNQTIYKRTKQKAVDASALAISSSVKQVSWQSAVRAQVSNDRANELKYDKHASVHPLASTAISHILKLMCSGSSYSETQGESAMSFQVLTNIMEGIDTA